VKESVVEYSSFSKLFHVLACALVHTKTYACIHTTGTSNIAPNIGYVCLCFHRLFSVFYMRVICKFHGLTLLLQVRTLWRCSDSVFFKLPPLASNALLTMLCPLLENVVQNIDHLEISCLGSPYLWLEKPRNCMGWALYWILCLTWKKWICGTPLEHSLYSPDRAPCNFWAFPTMKRELWGKKFQSDWWPAACFREVGGAL
jgi:hypothetical protein